MNNSKKIQSFTQLDAWKKGHELVILVYKMTSHFPKSEMFGLTSQMRRSAISITSNIAEGFSRKSYKDKTHFYIISLGSVTELQNQTIVAQGIKYISPEEFNELTEKEIRVHKILNGLIRSSVSRNS